jgi:hypothetical protein
MRLPRVLPTEWLTITAALVLSGLGADEPPGSAQPVDPAIQGALDRISADSLRGHLSFLASDLLEGRGTPSKGLDIAAEYIAAQFRRAGLEPVGDDGYFQTADWKYLAPEPDSFACEFKLGDEAVRVDEGKVTATLTAGLDLPPTATVKVNATDADALKALAPEQVAGKVVLAEVPHPYKADRARVSEVNTARVAFLRRMEELNPALVVDVDRDPEGALGLRSDVTTGRPARPRPGPPRVTLHSPRLARAFDAIPAGPSGATLSLRVGEPKERTAKVRNVVGLLRGSDPDPKETYVLLSAHYDHLGVGPHNGSGDRIYNGANDDGSGTVSVIEVASALAAAKHRPRRSLVFVAFYGEEHGLVGSRYYTAHPVVPLGKTVAAINLEQLGRTDDSEGPRVAAATVTGFDYSDVGPTLRRAGEAVGVGVSKHPVKSDAYFGASDNASLAREGIPAHTISVAFAFPDYHGADDEWEKIDFANMARIDRMVCLGLLMIADQRDRPRWDETNPKAARFVRPAGGQGR